MKDRALEAVLSRLANEVAELRNEVRELKRQDNRSYRHLEKGIMGNQDTLNAEAAKVDTLIANQKTLIQTTSDLVDEVKALKDANPDLDFTALDQKLSDAEAAVDTANTSFPDPGKQPGT